MADQPKQVQKELKSQKGPTTAQVIAVITLLPVGGTLLTLAGLTLAGTVIGLAVLTPLFILFSPVLVPAGITLALAVTGFLASGAFGLTALSSLSWMYNFIRGDRGSVYDQLEQAKRRIAEAAGHVGQRAGHIGQGVQAKAGEGGGRS